MSDIDMHETSSSNEKHFNRCGLSPPTYKKARETSDRVRYSVSERARS
jgi:hypothetical protein